MKADPRILLHAERCQRVNQGHSISLCITSDRWQHQGIKSRLHEERITHQAVGIGLQLGLRTHSISGKRLCACKKLTDWTPGQGACRLEGCAEACLPICQKWGPEAALRIITLFLGRADDQLQAQATDVHHVLQELDPRADHKSRTTPAAHPSMTHIGWTQAAYLTSKHVMAGDHEACKSKQSARLSGQP